MPPISISEKSPPTKDDDCTIPSDVDVANAESDETITADSASSGSATDEYSDGEIYRIKEIVNTHTQTEDASVEMFDTITNWAAHNGEKDFFS